MGGTELKIFSSMAECFWLDFLSLHREKDLWQNESKCL